VYRTDNNICLQQSRRSTRQYATGSVLKATCWFLTFFWSFRSASTRAVWTLCVKHFTIKPCNMKHSEGMKPCNISDWVMMATATMIRRWFFFRSCSRKWPVDPDIVAGVDTSRNFRRLATSAA
jgi:hypothetical protein